MKYLFLILSCFLIFPALAQKDTAISYFDYSWEPCKKKEAAYVRKQVKADSNRAVWDFYFPSMKLQMHGHFMDKAAEIKTGHFIWYNENGIRISEANYASGKKHGRYASYYENQVPSLECHYENGLMDGTYKEWHASGSARGSGTFRSDRAEGEWEWLHENGRLAAKESYKDSVLQEVAFYDDEGNRDDCPCITEKMPQFRGGEDARVRFLINNIRYPEEARMKYQEGQVFFRFVVKKDGSITELEMLRSSGYMLLDKEATRVATLMPNWEPAMRHNILLDAHCVMPITFRLE